MVPTFAHDPEEAQPDEVGGHGGELHGRSLLSLRDTRTHQIALTATTQIVPMTLAKTSVTEDPSTCTARLPREKPAVNTIHHQ